MLPKSFWLKEVFLTPDLSHNLIKLNLDKPIRDFMNKKPLFVSTTQTLGEVAEAMGAGGKDIAVSDQRSAFS